MAKGNIKATNFLINLDWQKDIFEDFDGNINEEQAGKIFVYLFKSMKEILLYNGKQIRSGDNDVDYPVKSLINQILRMRGENNVSDEEIAKMRAEGMSSKDISERLKQSGVKLGDSGVRARDGWKNYQKYVKNVNFDNNVNNGNTITKVAKIDNNDKYVF